jgi:hypothetical protein
MATGSARNTKIAEWLVWSAGFGLNESLLKFEQLSFGLKVGLQTWSPLKACNP